MEQIDPRKLLARVAAVLNRLNIPYLVTDGMAVLCGDGLGTPLTLTSSLN